jgi:hypothetical protein
MAIRRRMPFTDRSRKTLAMTNPLESNPLGILTFIVAPAILTNASSIMALGTSNRFARAIDRARSLLAEAERHKGDADPDAAAALRVRQLLTAERRVLLLVRALTAFYISVGCFAAASLVSLFAAVLFIAEQETLRQVTLSIAFLAGIAGVGGLVAGSGVLVLETRMALRILKDEATVVQSQHAAKLASSEH